MTLHIGLMSGTSLDGIDGVLIDFGSSEGPPITLRAHHHQPFAADLRSELLALNMPGVNELQRCEIAGNALARAYGEVVKALLNGYNVAASEVRAIGAHGQTVRHRPREFDGIGFTTQLLNGSLLAELCGIDVVCDFRRRDVAAGGHGAPLAPGLHAAMFAVPGESRAVLNLGGIANLTLLGADGSVHGFDCGPANALLDSWCQRHCGRAFDEGGHWAASGRVIQPLLNALLAEPYFAASPPKSTGRDLFDQTWLDGHLAHQAPGAMPVDVQATLAALTVHSVARDLLRHARDTSLLLVCGGGARNTHLLRGLTKLLPALRVSTTAEYGLPVDQVEGAAFAWLSHRFVERLPGNIVDVTGAEGPRVLGSLHPA
jgi:anhydro-N-acetylmuramic acid kinase